MTYPMPRPEPRRLHAPVIHLVPHPEVWALALRLAGHDVRRIRHLDDTSVLVVNNPSL